MEENTAKKMVVELIGGVGTGKSRVLDILKEDYAQRFDADFVLMTGILSKLTENLLDEFGGEKVRLG